MTQNTVTGPFNLLRQDQVPGADYPTMRQDSEGHTVLVVNSDQLYSYVGHLIAYFDADGHIIPIQIPQNGPVATTDQAITALETLLGSKADVAPNAEVQNVFDTLRNSALIQEQFSVVGTTAYALNGARAEVRSRETNLGRLAADSTLWFAQTGFDNGEDHTADVALKNGGGIRDTILGPNITRLTVSAALAFDNKLALVELTAAELIACMENAVSRVPALDGRFPHLAGMRIEYDPSQPGIQNQRRASPHLHALKH